MREIFLLVSLLYSYMRRRVSHMLELFPSKAVVLLCAIFLLYAGGFAYRVFSGYPSSDPGPSVSMRSMQESQKASASLEYAAPLCVNGSFWLAVFNPGLSDASDVYVSSGNVVNARLASLSAGSSDALELGPCGSIDVSRLMLHYCAGTCFSEPVLSGGRAISQEPGSACTPPAVSGS